MKELRLLILAIENGKFLKQIRKSEYTSIRGVDSVVCLGISLPLLQ
jgi:hypothetical protein